VRLTVETLAVNELREPCHHHVETIEFLVRGGAIDSGQPASAAVIEGDRAEVDAARAVWDDVASDLKRVVRELKVTATARLAASLQSAGVRVQVEERKQFVGRRKELARAISNNVMTRLDKEAARTRARAAQISFDPEEDRELQRKLRDLDAEIALRRHHYDAALRLLTFEEERVLQRLLPLRYKLHGDAQVLPVAVEIVLPWSTS
jgi:delta 1-pyrroline-5-carboxylate dehydrogenase